MIVQSLPINKDTEILNVACPWKDAMMFSFGTKVTYPWEDGNMFNCGFLNLVTDLEKFVSILY